MNTRRAPAPVVEPPDPPILHHYLLVPIVELVILIALAWLGNRFR